MERYYQLIDRDTSTISVIWKVVHLTCLSLSSFSGFAAAYSFGFSIQVFGNNCILDSKILFTEANVTKESLLGKALAEPIEIKPIDMASTQWGRMSHCYFCQFTPLVSMIFGIIWSAFFMICSKGGAGFLTDTIYRPWRLIYPAVLFSIIATVILIISTFQLSIGVSQFCREFAPIFNTTKCTNNIDKYTRFFSETEKESSFISILKGAIFFSYTCFISWLLLLCTLILRIICIADFQMVKITVIREDDEEELDSFSQEESDTASIFSNDFYDTKNKTSALHRRHSKQKIIKQKQTKSLSRESSKMFKIEKEKIKKTGSSGFIVSRSREALDMPRESPGRGVRFETQTRREFSTREDTAEAPAHSLIRFPKLLNEVYVKETKKESSIVEAPASTVQSSSRQADHVKTTKKEMKESTTKENAQFQESSSSEEEETDVKEKGKRKRLKRVVSKTSAPKKDASFKKGGTSTSDEMPDTPTVHTEHDEETELKTASLRKRGTSTSHEMPDTSTVHTEHDEETELKTASLRKRGTSTSHEMPDTSTAHTEHDEETELKTASLRKRGTSTSHEMPDTSTAHTEHDKETELRTEYFSHDSEEDTETQDSDVDLHTATSLINILGKKKKKKRKVKKKPPQ